MIKNTQMTAQKWISHTERDAPINGKMVKDALRSVSNWSIDSLSLPWMFGDQIAYDISIICTKLCHTKTRRHPRRVLSRSEISQIAQETRATATSRPKSISVNQVVSHQRLWCENYGNSEKFPAQIHDCQPALRWQRRNATSWSAFVVCSVLSLLYPSRRKCLRGLFPWQMLLTASRQVSEDWSQKKMQHSARICKASMIWELGFIGLHL